MSENPKCLFTNVDCVAPCGVLEKATDRMGMNRWRRIMDSIELSMKTGRKVDPGDLPDPVSGIEFATRSGATMGECLDFQQQMQKIQKNR